VLGLLVGTNHNEFDFAAELPGVNFTPQANAGDSDADTLYLNGYAAFALGSNAFIDVAIGYESSDYTLGRNPVFQESTRTIAQTSAQLTADTEGTTVWSSLNGGVDFGARAFSGGVYAGVTFAKSDLDGYTERDVNASGLAMICESTSRESLRAHAGVRAAYTFSTSHGIVVPQLRVEYQHEFEDDPDIIRASFLLDPQASEFQWTGAPRDPSAIEAGLGISAAFANGWQPFFNVDMLLGSDDLERTRVTLGVRVEL
jgi:outer membrane autotransporter protein